MASSIVSRMARGEPLPNVVSEAKTFLQKTKAKTAFAHFDFDVDLDWGDFICGGLPDWFSEASLDDALASRLVKVQTRGGFHVLIKLDGFDPDALGWPKDWYNQLKRIADASGDQGVPIPGTIQGGHEVKMI